MRWGRSGSPAGLICGKDRMGAPPPTSFSSNPVPRDVRVLPPPQDASTATRGRRRSGSARGPASGVPGPGAEKGAGGSGPRPARPARWPGTSGGAAPPPPPPPPPAAGRACDSGFPFFASPRLGRDPRGGGGHSPYYRWRRCFGQSLV